MTRRALLGATAVLASAPLPGCATFGTNVKGSFSCSAPDGVCAPSSVIDDRALALIAGERVPRPAAAPAAESAILRTPDLAAGKLAHSGQRVLRIVFPAHVDGLGRYHERSAVQAVVAPGTWLAPAEVAATPSPGPALIDEPAQPPAISGAVAPAGAPSAEAVLAARARAIRPPISRPTLGTEAEPARGEPRPAANQPASFPARVED